MNYSATKVADSKDINKVFEFFRYKDGTTLDCMIATGILRNSVCCVLHTNKAKDDSGMKGHLGTMLLQKASDVFEVKKDNGTFNVTETDCRNQPIEDFAFSIDGNGIPFPATTPAENKHLQRLDNIRKILVEVFATADVLSYSDLVEAYKQHGAVAPATAKRAVADAKKNDIIKLIPNTGYSMV